MSRYVYRTFAAGLLAGMLGLVPAHAAPLQVALSDFEVTAGGEADIKTAGRVDAKDMARQGAFVLGQVLLEDGALELVDRRELLHQLEKESSGASLIRSAQQVNADVLVEGEIQSFSTRRESINQGGYATEFQELQLRVGLEARDTVNGRVIAMSSGSGTVQIRQTANQQTQYGEADLLRLQENAVREAVPALVEGIQRHRDRMEDRKTIALTVRTPVDPALVEIDGLLVGSTPLENLPVYAGDHVITVGKAGYRDVVKRIKLDQDTQIEVPLIRTELSAEEVKEVLNGARVNAYLGLEPALIIEHNTNP